MSDGVFCSGSCPKLFGKVRPLRGQCRHEKRAAASILACRPALNGKNYINNPTGRTSSIKSFNHRYEAAILFVPYRLSKPFSCGYDCLVESGTEQAAAVRQTAGVRCRSMRMQNAAAESAGSDKKSEQDESNKCKPLGKSPPMSIVCSAGTAKRTCWKSINEKV